jgi:hypothetical protein
MIRHLINNCPCKPKEEITDKLLFKLTKEGMRGFTRDNFNGGYQVVKWCKYCVANPFYWLRAWFQFELWKVRHHREMRKNND